MKTPTLMRGFVFLCLLGVSFSQTANDPVSAGEAETEFDTAGVVLDGEVLFQVRGVSAYPPEKRARSISARIRAFADTSMPTTALRIIEDSDGSKIAAHRKVLVAFTSADAEAEGVSPALLAKIALERTTTAIESYRAARTTSALLRATGFALATTVAFVLILFALIRSFRPLQAATERLFRRMSQSARDKAKMQSEAPRLLNPERLGSAVGSVARALRFFSVIAVCLFYLNVVLTLFPWTKPLSKSLLHLVFDPLQTIAVGFAEVLPDLAFIAVLFILVRYLLKIVWTFFYGVQQGSVVLPSFDPDWATPTYRIIRMLAIAFALIVAYPYMPGSSSDAFKGISIFAGLVFSLASSSFLAHSIAGYALTFRRIYKVGDRVSIGDIVGDVQEIAAQATYLRTPKNEIVILPNSLVMNSYVVNYSTLAKQHGLILHTSVDIRYETPWRQVEAMLLLAAARTRGLVTDVPPFVLQKRLGGFAVTYELNVYSDQPRAQAMMYASLHRNILDIFNEYGVQIMTPRYETDPVEPKVVPRAKWFETPAQDQTEVVERMETKEE